MQGSNSSSSSQLTQGSEAPHREKQVSSEATVYNLHRLVAEKVFEMKPFQDKQNLGELIARRPAL